MNNINKKRYNNIDEAVAFIIAFAPMIFSYDSFSFTDLEKETCSRCRKTEQISDFLAPKANCNKKFGVLDSYHYGFCDEIKNDLIEHFDVAEEDFRPIRNKDGSIVFWQITPQHTMRPINKVNRIRELKPCRKCGSIQHRCKPFKNKQGEEFLYITKDALDDMHDINQSFEKYGLFIPYYVVSKRVYEHLINKYPRMTFLPMFLKE